jgi:hypothetical protein
MMRYTPMFNTFCRNEGKSSKFSVLNKGVKEVILASKLQQNTGKKILVNKHFRLEYTEQGTCFWPSFGFQCSYGHLYHPRLDQSGRTIILLTGRAVLDTSIIFFRIPFNGSRTHKFLQNETQHGTVPQFLFQHCTLKLHDRHWLNSC